MHGAKHLILTVDYELFGNGSGSLLHCVIIPLERMAAIAERHGAKLEIFVEALEFAAIERSAPQAERIATVKRQLSDMVRRGHRLQFHLHPQWHEARLQDGNWVLDEREWRTGDIGAARLMDMLNSAQQWLRSAVADVEPEYGCTVFRAGGSCIQPARIALAALRALRMTMDSSVAPGVYSTDAVSWYDFRNCPSAHWWRVEEEVTCAGKGEFLEVPIAVGRVNALQHVRARMQRAQEGEFCDGCSGTYRNRQSVMRRVVDLLQKVWSARRAMLDYCALPADLMIDVTRDWSGRFSSGDLAIPVVAIGHTKNFSIAAEREFERYLQWAKNEPSLQFSSYDAWRVSGTAGGASR